MSRRDHTEMEELAASYALDALESDEVDAFERHLSECPRCRADVQEYRETASLLAHAGAGAPDGLWDRIASELDDAPEGVAAVLPFGATSKSRRLISRPWRAGLVAAAAVVALLLGVNTATLVRQNSQISRINTAQSIASLREVARRAQADPTSQLARLTSSDGTLAAEAVVTRDGSGYLIATLDKLDTAHSYQLWGLVNGAQPVNLGVLGDHVEVATFKLKGAVSKLAVTVEGATRALAPTTTPILAGNLVSQ